MLGLALAAACWWAADHLPESLLSDRVGADGVPKGLAVALALICVALALRRSVVSPVKGEPRALGIAALGFVYVAVVPLVGYVIATALLAAAGAYCYGGRSTIGIGAFALGTATLLWLTFGALLGIPLPG